MRWPREGPHGGQVYRSPSEQGTGVSRNLDTRRCRSRRMPPAQWMPPLTHGDCCPQAVLGDPTLLYDSSVPPPGGIQLIINTEDWGPILSSNQGPRSKEDATNSRTCSSTHLRDCCPQAVAQEGQVTGAGRDHGLPDRWPSQEALQRSRTPVFRPCEDPDDSNAPWRAPHPTGLPCMLPGPRVPAWVPPD